MKLIIKLLLIFAQLYLCYPGYAEYNLKGELQKNNCGIIYPDDDINRNRTYYINIRSFRFSKLYFEMIMHNGRFNDPYMFKRESEKEPEIPIKYEDYYGQKKHFDSWSRTSPNFKINNFYTNETYYYNFYRQQGYFGYYYNHLYITPPTGEFRYRDNSSYIKVCWIEQIRIPIELWYGAGAFVLVVYILIIVFYQYKRAPKQKQFDTTIVKPIAINASPSTNASYQND